MSDLAQLDGGATPHEGWELDTWKNNAVDRWRATTLEEVTGGDFDVSIWFCHSRRPCEFCGVECECERYAVAVTYWGRSADFPSDLEHLPGDDFGTGQHATDDPRDALRVAVGAVAAIHRFYRSNNNN